MIKTLYILSSKAGKTEFDIRKKDLEKLYRNHKREKYLQIVETSYKNHASDAALAFIKENFEDKKNIIVAGGDGSLNEIASVIYKNDRKNTNLGLIPMGTANDFSKVFSYDNFKLEDLLNPRAQKIDLYRANGKIGINILSLGFDTLVLQNSYKEINNNPKLGKKAYILGVLKSLKDLDYKDLEFKLLDENDKILEFKGEFLLTAICNGSYYGSGFNPAPKARLDDGLLNLVYAKKLPTLLLPFLIIAYKLGRVEKIKYLEEIKIKKGYVKSDKNFLANIDGEIFESREIHFEVIKNAINWLYF